MPNPLAQLPRHLTLGLLSLGRRHGVGDRDLLAGTDLRTADLSDRRVEVTAGIQHQVIRNLTGALPPELPLPIEAALDHHLWALPAWGQAMVTAPTLGDALTFTVRFAQGIPLEVGIDLERRGDTFAVRFSNAELPSDVATFLTVRRAAIAAMTVRELLGRPLPLRSVSYNLPAPPYAAAVERFSGVPVTWGAERSETVAEARWLTTPLDDDPAAHAHAVARCWRLRQEFDDGRSLTSRVQQVLADEETLAGASLAMVAATLHTSERSVRRRLAAEGTSFRTILARTRQASADRLFAAGLSVEATAERLGYADSTSFAHAFKRWTGVSPEAWRRSRHARPA